MYLDSLINDHFLADVGGPRFVNPIFYSLAHDVLSVCIGVANICRGRHLLAWASHFAFFFLLVCFFFHTSITVEHERDLYIFT